MTADELALGIDVSKWQTPARIDWNALAVEHAFVYVRATYGTHKDTQAIEHVKRARAAGLAVGLYHFFRISQNIVDQARALVEVAEAVRLGPGDLLPAIDVEADTSPKLQPVRREWGGPLRTLVESVSGTFGGAVVYSNRADLAALGDPEWVRAYHLWIAHWGASSPSVPPGWEWAIWQCRVGTMPGIFGADLDQDVARRPLPTIRDMMGERGRLFHWIGETARQAREGEQ